MAREHETSVQPWGTLEELLLACAVNRHGTKSWDSIAMELANRINTGGGGGNGGGGGGTASVYLTPDNCKDRFDELKQRFMSRNDDEPASFVPMVDELKKIRVEELRREVRRRDVSIVSLELKVKRLEEERERSLKETEDDSRKNIEEGERRLSSPGNRAGKSNSGDASDSRDRENRSYNESNSTTQKRDSRRNGIVKGETEPEPERNELDPPRTESEPGKVVDGDENETMAREDNAKQSSDVQSSMSLSKNKRRRKGSGSGGAAAAVSSSGEEPEGGDEVSPATKRVSALKSEPLVKLLGTIRSHRLGSVFQRRLRSQESQRYKNLIRQHLDLRTIEARLDKGLYLNGFHKFFRDLLLLFNNAVVFFRKSSPEYAAAQELRALVLKETNAKVGKARPFTPKLEKTKQESDHSAPAPKSNKSSSIIVTCGKRSKSVSEGVIISKKGENNKDRAVVVEEKQEKKINNSSNSSSFVTIDEKGVKKKRSQERGARRNEHEFGGNELSSHDALEVNKKDNAKKKQGVANFLKRMKQNSDNHNNHNNNIINNNNNTDVSDDDIISSEEEDSKVEKKEKTKKKMMKKNGSGGGGRNNNIKPDERQERVTRNSTRTKDEGRKTRRGVGRPPKKPEKASKTTTTTTATAATTGGGNKRGRDNSEPDVGVGGRLKKRSRR
ncbi:uncharacterized protein LOC133790303 [Humulus lupulus]|uniref:uncharacterized protein LOC133790303 n=1 Tax=Humulus lupulus TaxID=3486 RepID=UPI002B40CE46|nr:uncharacterized protein LOC133790303 [Humulus lupulus]